MPLISPVRSILLGGKDVIQGIKNLLHYCFCISLLHIMIDEFKKFIRENNLIKPGEKILLAVSGGIDSMSMTHLFLQSEYETGIAHCNFSLRGRESDKDEEMVKRYAGENRIPFYSTRFETITYAKKNGLSVQMAARELRYNWFEEIRKENNFDLVAVGHNLNDKSETLLINLIRGTGINGLTGIRPSHKSIIRPLLFATRQEIEMYCREHKIIFREDKSNADTKYTRNKIRHMIMPVMKEINPSVEITLNKTAELFTEINEIVSEYINDGRKRISVQKGEDIIISIPLLKTFPQNSTIIYELFKPYGITGLLLEDLLKIIEGRTGGQIFTITHRIIKNRKELIVSPDKTGFDIRYEIGRLDEFNRVPEIKTVRYISGTGGIIIPPDKRFAYIDAQKIAFPLIIRRWRTGDFFYPFGMKKKKKLSDYFIDEKYSIPEKEKALVIDSAGDVVWIIGERLDDRFRITDNTRSILILEAW